MAIFLPNLQTIAIAQILTGDSFDFLDSFQFNSQNLPHQKLESVTIFTRAW